MYIIRNEKDEAKALVADETAFRMVSRLKGRQEAKNFQSGVRAAFVLEDAAWGTDSVQILLWKGDYIYLRED